MDLKNSAMIYSEKLKRALEQDRHVREYRLCAAAELDSQGTPYLDTQLGLGTSSRMRTCNRGLLDRFWLHGRLWSVPYRLSNACLSVVVSLEFFL